ncbi:hypothetical protein [Pleionea litopenaei]|uniref:DUF2262 domain-containing protein n=1 Tax=Pleionea litopenaei TaxID=3070815 RepID=A0AA51RWF5_9GAMM|nr:hypothetical protein [Pleionea sp. HL-JVS1]WMS88815.1 hypothetical protein Q9312_07825 [Pleionea sp. HL-JVS1]
MSNTQFAFIDKESVPSREHLQKAIDALGFDLQLDPEFTPFEDEGFSPCILNAEEDVGFEIYYESVEDVIEDDEVFKAITEGKNFCISMCWGGSLKDCACVMIVSSAFAKEFGAIVSYQGEEPEPLEKMISDAHDIIIKEAELAEIRAKERQKLVEEAKRNGNVKALALELLSQFSGATISHITMYTGLAFSTSNGTSVMSKAFILRTESGEEVDVTRYSRVRARQLALMQSSDGEFNPEQQSEWDSIEASLETAMESDDEAKEVFMSIVESWPEELESDEITWPENDMLKITFSNVPDVHIQFWTFDSMLSSISISSDILAFELTPGTCKLMD